jgi:D-3-phosphoglycerate dehydrogenase / 2-oxoglutarate reductase
VGGNVTDRPRIALLAPLPAEVVGVRFPDVEVVTPEAGVPSPAAEVAACRGATVVIGDWSGRRRVGAEVAAALDDRCRLVQVPATGLDGIDLEALTARGIPVASCAGLNTTAVAEWCVWAVLDALRGLSAADRAVRAGAWPQLGEIRHELAGRTVGIVGLGRIGAAVAHRLRPFDVDVHYVSRSPRSAEREAELGVSRTSFAELLPRAQVLVLACALTDETRHLLDADAIARLPGDAVVVNAARGEVADEAALAEAVASGRLHAVVTDVYGVEPAPADHPMRGHERITTTPHLAGASTGAAARIITRVFDNVGAALAGDPPVGLVDR